MNPVAYGIALPAIRGVLAPPVAPPLDPMTGVTITGAWSVNRALLSSFAGQDRLRMRDTSSGAIDDVATPAAALAFLNGNAGTVVSLYDHSGNARTLTNAATALQPALVTGVGALSRAGAQFDASDDFLQGAALSNFMSAVSGYVICAGLFAALTANNDVYLNQPLWRTSTSGHGAYAKSGGSLYSYAFDNTFRCALGATVAPAVPFVHEWWQASGQLYSRVNAGTTYQAVCGDTSVVISRLFGLGQDNGRAGAPGANGTILEIATMSARPAQADALVADMMALYGIDD